MLNSLLSSPRREKERGRMEEREDGGGEGGEGEREGERMEERERGWRRGREGGRREERERGRMEEREGGGRRWREGRRREEGGCRKQSVDSQAQLGVGGKDGNNLRAKCAAKFWMKLFLAVRRCSHCILQSLTILLKIS